MNKARVCIYGRDNIVTMLKSAEIRSETVGCGPVSLVITIYEGQIEMV